MATYDYDLLVLGSGSGGFTAARTARDRGLERILVCEKRRLGYSLCTNEGCMPSKTLLASAAIKNAVDRAAQFGIDAPSAAVDWRRVQRRMRHLVEEDFFSARRDMIERSGIEIAPGAAQFMDAHTISVGEKTVTADKIVIATGSSTSAPAIPGLADVGFIDSDRALYLDELPSSIIVVGAGYIGVELGYLMHEMGVRTTILQRSGHILSRLDADIGTELQRLMRLQGIDVITDVRIKEVVSGTPGKTVLAITPKGERSVSADEILVVTGRRPASDELGLERAGIATDEYGAIVVDEFMRTTQSHVYAVGDVNGQMPLVYAATMEGQVAGANASGGELATMDYRCVAGVVFSHPEVGAVGLTEAEARAAGHDVIIETTPMADIGKAVAIGETGGFVKLIAARPTGEILGVHIVGPHATDVVQVALPHLYHHDTVFDVLRIPYPHPTLGEALSYAAEEIAERLA